MKKENVEETVNNIIDKIEEDIKKTEDIVPECEDIIKKYHEILQKLEKTSTLDDEKMQYISKFNLEEIHQKLNQLEKQNNNLNNALSELLEKIIKIVSNKFHNIPQEMIEKKYNSKISELEKRLDNLNFKYYELQNILLDGLELYVNNFEKISEIHYQDETKRAQAEAELKKLETEAYKKWQEENEKKQREATQKFMDIVINSDNTDIGKVVYEKTKREYEGENPKLGESITIEEAKICSNVIIALRNEFNLTGEGDCKWDTTNCGWTGNPYTDAFAEFEYTGGIGENKLFFVPEEECTLDEIEKIELVKKKMELLKQAKNANPEFYNRPGKIYLPKLDQEVIINAGFLIDYNIDPDEVGWRDLEENKKQIPSEITAKKIIRKAKQEKISLDIMQGIKSFFKNPLKDKKVVLEEER